MEEERSRIEIKRENCPFCRDAVRPGEENVACKACLAWHHSECWEDHGACATCGGTQFSGMRSQVGEHCSRGTCTSALCPERLHPEALGADPKLCVRHTAEEMRSIVSTNAKLAWVGGVTALLCLLGALSYKEFFYWHGGTKHSDYVVAALLVPLIPAVLALLGYVTQRKFTKELQPLEGELGDSSDSGK